MNLGENIRNHRRIAKLTQEQLAQKCGLATITIRQYENEKRQPRIETLEKIAKALDIPFSALYDIEDPIQEAAFAMEKFEALALQLDKDVEDGFLLTKSGADSFIAICERYSEMKNFAESILKQIPDENFSETYPIDIYTDDIEKLKINTQQIMALIKSIEQERALANNLLGDSRELVKHYNKLNAEGKAVAVQRVEELSEIPKYQREPENSAKKELPLAENKEQPKEE